MLWLSTVGARVLFWGTRLFLVGRLLVFDSNEFVNIGAVNCY